VLCSYLSKQTYWYILLSYKSRVYSTLYRYTNVTQWFCTCRCIEEKFKSNTGERGSSQFR